MTNIPGFFMMPGFPKCGTTSMANWIGQHPEITMSNPKEPRFFEREYWLGLDFYKSKYFSSGLTSINGEARVVSATIGYIIPRVLELIGKPKIIFMIREPVARFVSNWNYWRAMRPGREIRSLQDTIMESVKNFDLEHFNSEAKFCSDLDPAGGPYRDVYLESGHYIYYIEKYKKHFDCHICLLEDVIKDQQGEYNKITDFLGADRFRPEFTRFKVNEYEKSASRLLKGWYHDDVERLSNLMGRNLCEEWGYR